MGSVENVAKAKGELLQRLTPGSCAVVNHDDPHVASLPSPTGVRRISFGLADTDVCASRIESCGIRGQRFCLHIGETTHTVTLAAFGKHSIYNALAAAAAAHALGVPPEIIVNGLEMFRPYDKRFRLENINGLVLIDDSYNANPASLGAALETLADLKGAHSAYIALGDMLELGNNQDELHRIAGVQAAQVANRLYTFGAISSRIAEGALSAGMPDDEVVQGLSHEQIVKDIIKNASEGDFVLVKGSRGMKMENVAEGIRQLRR